MPSRSPLILVRVRRAERLVWVYSVAIVTWATCVGCSNPTPQSAAAKATSADASTDLASGDVGLDFVATDSAIACPGGGSCPCSSHDECATGVCADDGQSTTGKACAFAFGGGCAAGYIAMTAIAGEGTSVCVPAAPKLCNPCDKDDDCKAAGGTGALCVDHGAAGRFCGVACPAGGCPAGYTCKDATGVTGAKAKQCQRSEQVPPTCACSPAAAALQLTTSCFVANAAGTCGGVRMCTVGGLTACSGKVPTPESCNSQDDDCNAQTDEGPVCDDGSACTQGDGCSAGTCKPGPTKSCDDANDCTDDTCDTSSGKCLFLPSNGGLCSDGDPCTAGEACQAGMCKGGVVQPCACANNADCAGQEDGNLCNGSLYCDPTTKKCSLNLSTVVVCADDGKPCTQGVCNPLNGLCDTANLPATTTCSDGLPWTVGDNCQSGVCTPGTATKQCKANSDCGKYEDGNLCNGTLFCNKATGVCQILPPSIVYCPNGEDSACQQNLCDPKSGACTKSAVNELKACEDGNLCTTGEACQAGKCQAGPTAKTCICAADSDCLKYEDGDLCNGTLFCNVAKLTCEVNPTTVVQCPTLEDTTCSKNSCVKGTGKCVQKAVLGPVPCDADGSPCTPIDSCTAGACLADTANICQCQQDVDCGAYEDGDLCNGTLYCDKAKGVCMVNPKTVTVCPSGGDSTCNKNQCVPTSGACKMTAVAGVCSDDSICTVADECAKGVCLPGPATSCDDLNPCTNDTCQSQSGCVFVPNLTTCDADSDPCTAGDACKGGACLPGAPTACDDANVCTDDACEKGKGCAYVANAAPCKDDGSPCTLDLCKDAGCAHPPGKEGVACSDADPCTLVDACKGGVCLGAGATVCDDGNVCTADGCEKGKGCVALPAAGTCTDGDACTEGDKCGGGVCLAGAVTGCDDGNGCTVDKCTASGGCSNAVVANDTPCAGGKYATCQSGQCDNAMCPAGYLAAPVDVGTPGAAVACAAAGPVWGQRPLKPVAVYSPVVPFAIVADSQTGLHWQANLSAAAVDYSQAVEACDKLSLGGKDDWRVPSAHELLSVIDYYKPPGAGPALDIGYFTNAVQGYYWTSQMVAGAQKRWCVELWAGDLNPCGAAHPVQCVRTATILKVPSKRFSITSGGGIATDTWTGLQWTRALPVPQAWQAANDHCSAKVVDGMGGWRLPSIRELQGLTDYGLVSPAFDAFAFPGTPSVPETWFWSSTSHAGAFEFAWRMTAAGEVYNGCPKKDCAHQIRCVK